MVHDKVREVKVVLLGDSGMYLATFICFPEQNYSLTAIPMTLTLLRPVHAFVNRCWEKLSRTKICDEQL